MKVKNREQNKDRILKRIFNLILLGIGLILCLCIVEFYDSSLLYFWRSFILIAPVTCILYYVYEQMFLDDVIDWDALHRSNQNYRDQKQKEYEKSQARLKAEAQALEAEKQNFIERTAKEKREKAERKRQAKLQRQKDKNRSETGYSETDQERSDREYREEHDRLSELQKQRDKNAAETGYAETDQERSNREAKKDVERIENLKKFGKELTNKEILDEFEKQNIHLDLKTKTRIENQLNGLTAILELPYEIDVIRKKQFKHLNDIGIWYDVNNRRIVKFPKSEVFWNNAGGRDGTRGFDDWASK